MLPNADEYSWLFVNEIERMVMQFCKGATLKLLMLMTIIIVNTHIICSTVGFKQSMLIVRFLE